jgi:hypothetical protein
MNPFPPGWDERRVNAILRHYEQQSEEAAVAEDEAAFEDATEDDPRMDTNEHE